MQAQILQILLEANKSKNVSMLFISHDLEVVEKMCSRVAVMKNGKIIESGKTNAVFQNPRCEYTKRLLDARISL